MRPLTAKNEFSFDLIELRSACDQLFDPPWPFFYQHSHRRFITQSISCKQSVLKMEFHGIAFLHGGGDTTLRPSRVALGGIAFAKNANGTILCKVDCCAKPGNSGPHHDV